MKITSDTLRLYAVTDRSWLRPGETLASVIEELLKAGVTCVQLREKHAEEELLLREASTLRELCTQYQVPLIINDRPDIAIKVRADGVHVGQSDMAISEARKILGDQYLIGGSAHNVAEALAAQRAGADYIGCGAVFGSHTKQDATNLSTQELRAICEAVSIPAVAIGGISLDNVAGLQGTGIAGVAIVSGLFAAEDKTAAVARFLKCLQNIPG
ncbi:MAG: thiamine phosphate synthase [Lachnospiraceae bacterium]|nr:thiamine phosphate synthase [Lachnospiraceae bacterium]